MSIENIQQTLFSPSEEQQKIIDALKNKQNVIVNAVAGSGKTTTILGIAKQIPNINILQITYNKALQLEVEEKVKNEKLTNIKIYTYHGLACSFYGNGNTDDKLKHIILNDTTFKPNINIPRYSIIVIDETQDMSPTYFKLVYKFFKDIHYNGNLLILGDNYQCINEFLNADYRYLTMADEIFTSHKPFVKLTLNTSYRLTNTMARFINEFMMYNKVNINASKQGEPVIYHRLNTFSDGIIIAKYIINQITNYNAKPEDFFIIAPSIKNLKILTDIENNLVNANIKCYVPMADDSKLQAKILQNKVVFTTYNQAKGRERPYCIVLGFDTAYYKFNNKSANMNICENILYVAVSRASKQLILVEDYKHGSHPFLHCKTLIDGSPLTNDIKTFLNITKESMKKKFIDRKIIEEEIKKKQSILCHNTSVTNFTKYLRNEIVEKISILVDKLFIPLTEVEEKNIVLFPNDIKTSSSTYEEIFDIIAVTLPSMLEIHKPNQTNILHRISKIEVDSMVQNEEHTTISNEFTNIVYPCKNIKDWLHLGNFYLACINKLYYKIKQITNYDWITEKIIEGCHNNMKRNISSFNDLIFEVEQEITFTNNKYGQITLAGRFDAISNDTLWEFKCVDSLSLEHKLQLIIYSYMWQKHNNNFISNYNDFLLKDKININNTEKQSIQKQSLEKSKGNRQCKLMNIRTGEVLKLNTNNDACLCYIGGKCNNCDKTVETIIQLLLDNRYFYKEKINNNEFIKQNINDITNYLNVIDNFNTNNTNVIEVNNNNNSNDNDNDNDMNELYESNTSTENDDDRYDFDYTDSNDNDFSEDKTVIDYNKLKVDELIELCNKEFNDTNRIKNLKKKKKQELIDILINLKENKKEEEVELDF